MNFQVLQVCLTTCDLHYIVLLKFNNPIHWGRADLACLREDDIIALVRKALASPNLVIFLKI